MDSKEPQWTRGKDCNLEPIVVSLRDFDQILTGLRVAPEYFRSGQKILSVGEGLTPFAKTLKTQYGVEAYAMDPIYSISETRKPAHKTSLEEEITKKTKGRAVFMDKRTDKVAESLSPIFENSIAASAYEIPLPDGYFDFVMAHRLTEHIDLSLAMPEFIRLMRPNSEIRLGGVLTQVSPEKNLLHLGKLSYDGSTGGYDFRVATGLKEGLLQCRQQGLSAYVVTDGLDKRSEVRDETGRYGAGLIVIRNDELIPISTPLDLEELTSYLYLTNGDKDLFSSRYPYLGTMFKIDLNSLKKDSIPERESFSLKIINQPHP